jgi:uncharacterized membrane protein
VLAEKPEGWVQQEENGRMLKEEKRTKTISLLFLAAIGIIITNALWNQATVQTVLLTLTTVAGLFISFLVVQHELGYSNSLTEQLCGISKHADCDAVLHSNKSKLFKWMNWADAGIVYFSAILLITTLTSINSNLSSFIPLWSLLAVCSLPFLFFSLYYQWRVVKKWCTLCLLTVTVLSVQFIVLVPDAMRLVKSGSVSTSFSSVLTAAFMFTAVSGLWFLLVKPVLYKLKKKTEDNYRLLRFKNNRDIFNTLLQQQRRVSTVVFENDLQLGTPDAPVQIMVACNPYCSPCAKAHMALHELTEQNDIGLVVRFTIKADNKDKRTQAVEYILQLVKGKDSSYKRKVLHDWYKWMNKELFEKEYPLLKAGPVADQLLLHEQWVQAAGIKATPTLFINGFELPKQYRAEDLKEITTRPGKSGEAKNETIAENNLAFA